MTARAPKPIPDTSGIVAAWNAMASICGLSNVRVMPAARTRALQLRVAEVGREAMLEAVRRVGQSDFCRGDVNGWRATFDFLLQSSSLVKTLEGKYDNRVSPRPAFRNGALEILAQEWHDPIDGPAEDLRYLGAPDA